MSKKPKSGRRTDPSQLGIFNIPDPDDEPMDFSDDDMDLEAELAALSGDSGKRARPKKPVIPAVNLDAMIADSLKDEPSDDDMSGDEDDPDLLSELHELTVDEVSESPAPPAASLRPAPPPPGGEQASVISMLQDRITNYTAAENQAKESGETSRARRFGRGLKTLKDLLKQAKSGHAIETELVPPPVPLKSNASPAAPSIMDSPLDTHTELASLDPTPPPVPTRRSRPDVVPNDVQSSAEPSSPEPREPPPPPPEIVEDGGRAEGLKAILKRKEEFKAAALASKQAGDKTSALEFLKVVKQFDMVVEEYKKGTEMDLSELPTVEVIAEALKSQGNNEEAANVAEPTPPPAPIGLVTATSADEALRQRLAYFQEQESKAKESNNSSKARRMGRIVKQYEDAIKLNSSGKPIHVEELPPAPGFAPIPTGNTTSAPQPKVRSGEPSPKPSPAPSPAASSRHDKQLLLLLHRQKQFKEAAIKAKKEGDIDSAKEYLRAAKGFDSVIEAARGGLMVDFKSLPVPPSDKAKVEQTFEIVSTEDCGPSVESPTIEESDDDVLPRLQLQLSKQLKLSLVSRDHYKAMGNVAETNRFEHLALSVKQDLDVVALAKRLGKDSPKFHYESRQFSVVQCNTDLNENDLELTIVRGIAFNVPNPKEIDTYVKFEYPHPQEAPVVDRTPIVKDTNSPEFNSVFPLAIQRGSRPCLRVIKRHAIKLEVCSRGGWFSRDATLGTVVVKLAPLETQVTIHEAFPIMDGRRPAGGSLEVKLRVRTPILTQQIETTTHRWLVIDN